MIADRLNPIVVKELRQGLKSRAFTGSFTGLQALMVFSMIMYVLMLREASGDIAFADGLFWFLLGLLLVLVLPFRAFQALHDEQKNQTLEMVFLTRMTSWDIAFGKWLALVVQLGLMVTAVLPYLVLRYFLGTINVFEDLLTLGLLVWVAMLLIAAGVGFSGWKSKLLRGLLIAGAVFSLYMLPMMLYGVTRSMGARLYSQPAAWAIGLVSTFLLMLFLVEYGASTIAPPAENHARRKRTLALVILGFFCVAVWLSSPREMLLLGLLFMLPICIDALCEPYHLVPSLYRGTAQMNPLRRAWRRLTYPGWPSGLVFVTALMALMAIILLRPGLSFPQAGLLLLSFYGTLIFPLALILLVRRRITDFTPHYLLIQLTLFIVSMVLLIIGYMSQSAFDAFARFIPMTACIGALAQEGRSDWFPSIFVVTLACLVILMTRGLAPWHRILAMEKAD